MAILNELDVSTLSAAQDESVIRELVSGLFWAWYASNVDKKITSLKWWIFRKTIYVRDLESVFELLFGPMPAARSAT